MAPRRRLRLTDLIIQLQPTAHLIQHNHIADLYPQTGIVNDVHITVGNLKLEAKKQQDTGQAVDAELAEKTDELQAIQSKIGELNVQVQRNKPMT